MHFHLVHIYIYIQGDPIDWVSIHRYHHQFTDSVKDPHSPMKGFWYSHIGWLYDFKSAKERVMLIILKFSYKYKLKNTLERLIYFIGFFVQRKRSTNVRDLENQFFYKFIHNTYIIHPIILATLLYVIGGFPYIVWGMVCIFTYIYCFVCFHLCLQLLL